MPDYIPDPDAEFEEWFAAFLAYCVAHKAELGLSDADILEIQVAKATWSVAYSQYIAAHNAAAASTETKEEKRDDGERVIRKFVKIIQARPGVTDAQRENLGITVRDTNPTPLSEDIVRTTPAPRIELDWSKRGQVIVHFGPNPGDERNNGLPQGIKGAKLWFYFGTGPTDAAAWQWLADDTNSPYTHIVPTGTALTVTYRAQYFDRRMRLGTFSDPVTATITA
jgi:hypothetical protein